MRYISYALTTRQVRDHTKDVTRRLGWRTLKPGTLLQPAVKCQGLKKGERIEPIGGPIRVVSVKQESLLELVANEEYGKAECAREGFPELSPREFVEMFCRHNGCAPATVVTRIEFAYEETHGDGGRDD